LARICRSDIWRFYPDSPKLANEERT
jgi:hypothetical protein